MLKISKSTLIYIILLVLIGVIAIFSFVSENNAIIEYEKERDDYYKRKENAVTVVATFAHASTHLEQEVKWNMGAGDDVDKQVINHVYYTRIYTYTYNGEGYSYGVRSQSAVNPPKGSTIELQIDPNDPGTVFQDFYPEHKPGHDISLFFCVSFFAVLIYWIVKTIDKRRKSVSSDETA